MNEKERCEMLKKERDEWFGLANRRNVLNLELSQERDKYAEALWKINNIRNDMIARQFASISLHVYPLVSALNEAGIKGKDYKDAQAELVLLIDKYTELKAERDRLKVMLGKARSDIWQTARANQGNINGVDMLTPGDEPCKEWIGNHFVHQAGVDESLGVIAEIDALLAESEGKG